MLLSCISELLELRIKEKERSLGDSEGAAPAADKIEAIREDLRRYYGGLLTFAYSLYGRYGSGNLIINKAQGDLSRRVERFINDITTKGASARTAGRNDGMQPMIQPSSERAMDYDKIKKALAAMEPCPEHSCQYSMSEDGILSFSGDISSSRSFIDLLNAAAPVLAKNMEELQSHSRISNDLAGAIRDLDTSSHRIMAVKNCPFASVRNITDDIVLIDFAWIKILRRYLRET